MGKFAKICFIFSVITLAACGGQQLRVKATGECKNALMTGETCSECQNGKIGRNCDIDTVVIGDKTWMAKNMDAYIGRDGKRIKCQLRTANTHTEQDISFMKEHGCLYTWQDAIRACPNGFHLPTKEEFDALIKQAGGSQEASGEILRSRTWSGIDTFGFAALPAGWRAEHGTHYDFGKGAFLWSATESAGNNQKAYFMHIDFGIPVTLDFSKKMAFSVRCVKD